MATEILVKEGSAAQIITVGDSGEDFAITLSALAIGAAQQSIKIDTGSLRSDLFDIIPQIESGGTAPAAGTTVDCHWASSMSATAGTDNSAGTTGVDGAYKAGEVSEWLRQTEFLGSLVATNDLNTLMQQTVGKFSFGTRYGNLIVFNQFAQALRTVSTMVISFWPTVTESQ